MFLRSSWLLALLVFGCGGYDGGSAWVTQAAPAGLAVGPAAAPPPTRSDACDERQWLAVLPVYASKCPVPRISGAGAWLVSSLFEDHASVELTRYCAYEWGDRTVPPDTTALLALKRERLVQDLSPDCLVAAPAGTAAVDATWSTLRESFRQQTDALDVLPMGPKGVSAVRVAMVDTSPDGYAAGAAIDGGSGHGFALGRIIRELACPPDGPGMTSGWPPAACIAALSHHLALPMSPSRERDTTHGGSFGSFADLAKAIVRAVDAWVAARQIHQHLVLNLSVGWDGRWGGSSKAGYAGLEPGPKAVFAAIARASCLGALVVAAAGNDSGGPEVDPGPLYPAAWESLSVPNVEACKGFVEPREQPLLGPPSAAAAPLLLAAGGVEGDDRALAIGRGAGRPRLAAPATHAVADRFDGPRPAPTRVLTGTSVSAAVTSAIAAVIWGYRPELSREAVVDAVLTSAVPLGKDADFCLGGVACPLAPGSTAREIRRVGLCPALRLACAATAGLCPPGLRPTCQDRPAYVDARPRFDALELAAIDAMSAVSVSAAAVTKSLAPLGVCGPASIRIAGADYPPMPCPDRQLYTAVVAPWVGPQPGSAGCPDCSLVRDPGGAASSVLRLQIDDDYPNALTSPVLRVDGAVIVLPDLALKGGDTVTFEDIALPAATRGATISFAVLDPVTAVAVASTSSVLVVQ